MENFCPKKVFAVFISKVAVTGLQITKDSKIFDSHPKHEKWKGKKVRKRNSLHPLSV